MARSLPDDPSSAQTAFSGRLQKAIQDSGLSLSRIAARLATHDLAVSTATLSYWTSGRSRPSRNKSLIVVQVLEEVLRTESGFLTDALPGSARSQDVGEILGRDQLLATAVKDHALPSGADVRRDFVHRTVRVGEDGAEKEFTTETLQTSLVTAARGWAIAFDGMDRETSVEGLLGLSVKRKITVADDLFIFEFAFNRPLERGQQLLTRHRISSPTSGDPATDTGYATGTTISTLVMTVIFEGGIIGTPQRTFRGRGDTELTPVGEVHRVDGHTVQVVVQDAVAGLHSIKWA